MENPGWFNLFIIIGNIKQLGQSQPGNHAHKEASWWSHSPGEWNTVSFPISRFHKVFPEYETNPRIPPQLGDVVSSFLFSAPDHDRGLVIDRVWVTRGEPESSELNR